MTTGVQLKKKQKAAKQNRAKLTGAFFVGMVLPSWLGLAESKPIYKMEDGEYMIFKIRKNHPQAKTPAYAIQGDAGMDLYSVDDVVMKPMQTYQIHTGIEIELPPGTVGLIWDKSGLATKHGLTTMGGVFDEIYRGELIVTMINLSADDYKVKCGDKIAQLLIQKVEHPEVQEVEELSETERGRNRLGSTGVA